jgi:hypothetical protein
VKTNKKIYKFARTKFLLNIDSEAIQKLHILARQNFKSTTAYITEVLIKHILNQGKFGNS